MHAFLNLFTALLLLPQARNFDNERSGLYKMQATPVCSGVVLGRACVVTDLSQTSDIIRGDILITHCTDIGWSPYFPLLAGIVTELGGLISHGTLNYYDES